MGLIKQTLYEEALARADSRIAQRVEQRRTQLRRELDQLEPGGQEYNEIAAEVQKRLQAVPEPWAQYQDVFNRIIDAMVRMEKPDFSDMKGGRAMEAVTKIFWGSYLRPEWFFIIAMEVASRSGRTVLLHRIDIGGRGFVKGPCDYLRLSSGTPGNPEVNLMIGPYAEPVWLDQEGFLTEFSAEPIL